MTIEKINWDGCATKPGFALFPLTFEKFNFEIIIEPVFMLTFELFVFGFSAIDRRKRVKFDHLKASELCHEFTKIFIIFFVLYFQIQTV